MCKGQKKDEMDSRDIQDCILIVTEKRDFFLNTNHNILILKNWSQNDYQMTFFNFLFAGMSFLGRWSISLALCEKTLIREVIWNPDCFYGFSLWVKGDWYEYVVISRH